MSCWREMCIKSTASNHQTICTLMLSPAPAGESVLGQVLMTEAGFVDNVGDLGFCVLCYAMFYVL